MIKQIVKIVPEKNFNKFKRFYESMTRLEDDTQIYPDILKETYNFTRNRKLHIFFYLDNLRYPKCIEIHKDL